MAFDKRQALIDEGLTEAQADYMVSGGTKTDGLNFAADGTYGGDAEEIQQQQQGQPEQQQQPPAAGDAQAAVQDQQTQPLAADDPDSPEPPRDSPFYQQWHREKRRRQDLQEQLRQRDDRLNQLASENTQYREHWARLDERLRLFREASEQPQEQPAGPPDPEQDPFGYMRWQAQQIEALNERLNGTASQVQEDRAAQALRESYIQDARNFARQNPDFNHAYNWLMQNRDGELAAAGYVDPQERMRIILADERDIVARALTARQSPSQVIYGLAKARGFTPPAPAAAAAIAAAGGNGAAPVASARGGNGAPSVTEQVQNIQRGQQASRSLSSVGGSPIPTGIDLSRLISMNDDEYAAWRKSLSPAQRQEYAKLLGA